MSTHTSNWSQNRFGEVIFEHEFCDSELRKLNMSLDRIELELFHPAVLDHSSGAKVKSAAQTLISCFDPKLVSMRSDYLQNVVDKIFVYDFRSILENEVMIEAFDTKSFEGASEFEEGKLLYITPITGIELIVVCRKFEFSTNV